MIGSPDRPYKRIKRNKGELKEFDTLRQMIFTRVKQMYGDDRQQLFNNPVIILKKEEIPIMEAFDKYFNTCLLCGNCNKKPLFETARADPSNGDLLFTCDKCFCVTTDSTKDGRFYVKWFSNVLKRFSIESFDKMPDYIVAEGDEHFHEWLSSELTGDYKIKVTGQKEKVIN